MKRSRSRASRKRGMTLVEVILGAAVLAILVVVFMSSLMYPRWLNRSSLLRQEAMHAAGDIVEYLFSIPFYTVRIDEYDSLSEFRQDYLGIEGVYSGFEGVYPGFADDDFEILVDQVTKDDLNADEEVECIYIKVEVTPPRGGDPVYIETYRSSLK